MVNREQGKEAITEYEVLERIDDTHLRLALYPKTGRTHQLRVHCAHQEGLNAPIIGDPLYGNELKQQDCIFMQRKSHLSTR